MKKIIAFLQSNKNALCLLLILLFSLDSQAQRRATNIVSPDIQADNSVIFRIKAPDAHSVQLTGTWPAAFGNVIPMVKKDTITVPTPPSP